MKVFAILLSLFLLAVLVRAGAGMQVGLSAPLTEDEPEYYVPARSLAEGRGYCKVEQQSADGVERPTAYRMPLPSMVMAAVFKVAGGAGISTARWTSIVISALSAPLMWLFARQAMPRFPALLAGVGCAIYPTWVHAASMILSEPYFIPAMLAALILSVRAARSKTWPWALAAGLAWSVAALIRPHALVMGGAIGLLEARHSRVRAAIFLAAIFSLLLPWAIRNQIRFGHPVLLATEGGETLLGANNPYVLSDRQLHGMWLSPLKVPGYNQRLSSVHDDIERDHLQSSLAWAFLRSHPDQIPRLIAYKLERWLTPITVTGGAVRLMVLGSYGVLLVLLAGGGLLGVFKPNAALGYVVLCSLILTVFTIVYWGGLTRGRLPLEILWLPWGAQAGWEFVRYVGRGFSSERAGGVGMSATNSKVTVS
jgi:4-amino-4-deoxy-L-arabinose transferase-like glycosyltransferase